MKLVNCRQKLYVCTIWKRSFYLYRFHEQLVLEHYLNNKRAVVAVHSYLTTNSRMNITILLFRDLTSLSPAGVHPGPRKQVVSSTAAADIVTPGLEADPPKFAIPICAPGCWW